MAHKNKKAKKSLMDKLLPGYPKSSPKKGVQSGDFAKRQPTKRRASTRKRASAKRGY